MYCFYNCISQTRKEHEILNIAMEKWEQVQLALDNSKSDEGQSYYYTKAIQGNKCSSYRILISISFALKGPVREFVFNQAFYGVVF